MDDHGCVKISFDSCVQNHALVCWMECGSILVVQLRHHVFISRFLFLFFFFHFQQYFHISTIFKPRGGLWERWKHCIPKSLLRSTAINS